MEKNLEKINVIKKIEHLKKKLKLASRTPGGTPSDPKINQGANNNMYGKQ